MEILERVHGAAIRGREDGAAGEDGQLEYSQRETEGAVSEEVVGVVWQ